MSLLFLDSFDTYQTADLTQKWTQLAGGPSLSPAIGAFGRRSTQGVRFTSTAASGTAVCKTLLVTLTSPTGSDTCIVGFAFTHGSQGFTVLDANTSPDPAEAATNGTPGMLYVRNAGSTRVFLRVNVDGTVSVYNGSSTLLGTSSSALSQDVTAYVELKVKIHASDGEIDLHFNGLSVLSVHGSINTAGPGAGTTFNEVGIGHLSLSSNLSTTWTYDDVYIADGAGSIWNDFKGDTRVDALYVTAEGTHTDSTPSTGSDRAATVDETLQNGDTDYNTVGTLNHQDSFVVEDLPVAGADIYGVQVCMVARRTDAGSGAVNGITRISGTTYAGATPLGVPATYGMAREVMEASPATSAAWTESEFNAAEFGYRKTA